MDVTFALNPTPQTTKKKKIEGRVNYFLIELESAGPGANVYPVSCTLVTVTVNVVPVGGLLTLFDCTVTVPLELVVAVSRSLVAPDHCAVTVAPWRGLLFTSTIFMVALAYVL